MLPATTRRVSNSIASCSYTPTRAFAAARAKERVSTTPTRPKGGQSDFLGRLRAHQDAKNAQNTKLKDRPRQNTPTSLTVKGLKPFNVIERINNLVDEHKLDHAITMVENLPLDAVNVVVWNVLIQAAIKEGRYKQAFELYYDMKRRHVRPNTRTFSTLFVGLSSIEDWSLHVLVLERVFIAYDQLLVHFEKLKLTAPDSPELSTWPLNGFLVLLGKARRYSRMWDVFFSMEGRLAPDEVTYTIMLRALEKRTSLSEGGVETAAEAEERANMESVHKEQWNRYDSIDTVPEETLGLNSRYYKRIAKMDVLESVQVQNAADARLLWEQLQKAHTKDPSSITIEASHIALLLHLLAHGRPSDQLLGFDIVRDYVDIEPPTRTLTRKPTKQPAKPPSEKLPVTNLIFSSILELCVHSARAETAIQYFQTMAEKPNSKHIINHLHMLYVMRAFAMRRPAKGAVMDAREAISALEWMLREGRTREMGQVVRLLPGIDHFIYALTTAWRGADMSSALRVLEMMTGLKREQFMAPIPAGTLDPRDRWGRDTSASSVTHMFGERGVRYTGCTWNTTCMALLVKTARATEKREDLRIALRIVHLAGIKRFFFDRNNNGTIIVDEVIIAQRELATRIMQCVDWLHHHDTEDVETEMWLKLRDVAVQRLEQLTALEVKRQEDILEGVERRRLAAIQDDQRQPLVSVKGRKSQWAANV